jgi:hypothetical protein
MAIRDAFTDGKIGLGHPQQELPIRCKEGGFLIHPLLFSPSDLPEFSVGLVDQPVDVAEV